MPKQIIQIHLQPNAKRDEICGEYDGKIKIAITAQPIDGRANLALIKFLSKRLHISKSSIEIQHGLTGRDKTLCITSDTDVKELLK